MNLRLDNDSVLHKRETKTRHRGYETGFMLNSNEHGIFFANKYENVNNSLLAEKFSCSAMFRKTKFAIASNLLVIWDLFAGKS